MTPARWRAAVVVTGVAIALSLVGLRLLRGQSRCLTVSEATPVLERPFPMDYPSNPYVKPFPNRQIDVLAPGNYATVISKRYEKDFAAYSVELGSGAHGYVIGRAGTTSVVDCPPTSSKDRP